MSQELLESGLRALEFSRRNLLALLEDIPDDKLCHQPVAGGNHALWIMGHLTQTDEWFPRGFGGYESRLPAQWNELFGMGSKPVGDVSAYPPVAEIREAMNSRRQEMIGWFKSMPPEKLLEPLGGDWEMFAPNHVGLAQSIAWHEGMHTGQLTVVRKSLGIAPKYA